MTGTIINVITVLLGSGLGMLLGGRLPEQMRQTVLYGLGLTSVVIGLQMALGTLNILIVMGSLLVGGVLGEWWDIEGALERIGGMLEGLVSRGAEGSEDNARSQRFIRGYVTASLVFCVGPLSILGAIQDGLSGDYTLLAIKSLLDGFAALAFASTLGVGVAFSIVTIARLCTK